MEVPLLWKSLQHGFQFFTYKLHKSILDVTVRHVNHEDEGWWVGRLILLHESKQITHI